MAESIQSFIYGAVAATLLVGIDDNGQPTYKAKSGQYAKFGVRIWPEVLPFLGVDTVIIGMFGTDE